LRLCGTALVLVRAKVSRKGAKTQSQNPGDRLMDFKVAPIKPEITLADLDKIDVRVGTILSVEDVPGSDKLLKLTVDFGDHRRSILAGMKQERENPKEIEGKQALFVVNLPPRTMMGQVSEGMLFDIGYADGLTPVLAEPEKEIADGARAG
jgi:tRNA-binding protein